MSSLSKNPRRCTISRKGRTLPQRTGEHFKAWGILDRIEDARVIPASFGSAGVTTYKTLLSDYHYDWMRRADVDEFYAVRNMRLPQYAMERVLRDRVAELPTVKAIYGATVTRVEQDRAGIKLVCKSSYGERKIEAIYGVGCDGARSIVREVAGITQASRPNSRRMVLSVFRSSALHKLLERYPGKSYFNALHPDHGGYWQFLGRVDLGNSWFFSCPSTRFGDIWESGYWELPCHRGRNGFRFRVGLSGSLGFADRGGRQLPGRTTLHRRRRGA